MAGELRVRRSIDELQTAYANGDKKPLETLMRAWKGIKELPAEDDNSFFKIGGYHGEPFRGAGWGSAAYWGGYCNHGNVLFPTWHRVYLWRIEQALRSIPGCEEVTLPFWDETSEASKNGGIPWALTVKQFELDGVKIENPLRSFVFNRSIVDNISGDDPDYSKHVGYETVRYPLSGLMGPKDIEKTKAHNAQYPDYEVNVGLLNANVVDWLTSYIEVTPPDKDGKPGPKVKIPTNVAQKFADCLDAPNYTLFSNTTSAAEWNANLPAGAALVVPLESPHNSIHLSVGGCEVPNYDRSPIDGANGDMGENDTAGLDPIFFFHHCFVDRVFWLWQRRHGATEALEIIPHYPGTNSVDGQNPTPGVTPNSWLTMDSPLDPFVKSDGAPFASVDCVNIETQLGYTYGPGSLEDLPAPAALAARAAGHVPHVHVAGINRGAIRGSFMITAFAVIDGKKRHLGTEAVLSRWHVEGCANCQTHLEARAAIPIHGLDASAHLGVEVHTRDGLLLDQLQTFAAAAGAPAPKKRFRWEVR